MITTATATQELAHKVERLDRRFNLHQPNCGECLAHGIEGCPRGQALAEAAQALAEIVNEVRRITPGERVYYHGAFAELHGTYTLSGRCGCSEVIRVGSGGFYTCGELGHRQLVTEDGRILQHVSTSSFSPVF